MHLVQTISLQFRRNHLDGVGRLSAENDWLAMLEKATTYGDLQRVFVQMHAASQAANDGDVMVASIDEAIRRIEQERSRDQAELDGYSSDYTAFKQEQAGLIGWFKRKLPFTETRKQELSHRDAINDQTAEILADNFVIARAQMLKERIASPKMRRMGHEPAYWRKQFLNNEAVNTISEYGKVVSELGKELSTAKLFIKAVKVDIEAFSSAKFISQEDQRRSSEDLKAAQKEWQALADESQEKVSLRTAALSTLMGLLIKDLSEKDGDFRNTNHRLGLLKSLQDQQPRLAKRLEERITSCKALLAKKIEHDSLPEQREKLENTLNALKRDGEEAERKRLRTASELEAPSQLYHAALGEVERAKAALSATKPLYDAYIAEQNKNQQATAEVTSAIEFELAPSNVVAEYKRIEEGESLAMHNLRQQTPAFEQAKRSHDMAVGEVNTIRDKSQAHSLELRKIAEVESEMQQQLLKAKQSMESALPEFRVAAETYMDIARQCMWLESSQTSVRAIHELLGVFSGPSSLTSTSPSERLSRSAGTTFSTTFSTPMAVHGTDKPSFSGTTEKSGASELHCHCELMERALQAIEAERQEGLREVANLKNLRKEALLRRGQMLLDQNVLSDLDLSR